MTPGMGKRQRCSLHYTQVYAVYPLKNVNDLCIPFVVVYLIHRYTPYNNQNIFIDLMREHTQQHHFVTAFTR